jgi:hypothetical protein
MPLIRRHLSDSLLDAYSDDTLSSKQRDRVDFHLAQCTKCRQTANHCHRLRKAIRSETPEVSSDPLLRALAVTHTEREEMRHASPVPGCPSFLPYPHPYPHPSEAVWKAFSRRTVAQAVSVSLIASLLGGVTGLWIVQRKTAETTFAPLAADGPRSSSTSRPLTPDLTVLRLGSDGSQSSQLVFASPVKSNLLRLEQQRIGCNLRNIYLEDVLRGLFGARQKAPQVGSMPVRSTHLMEGKPGFFLHPRIKRAYIRQLSFPPIPLLEALDEMTRASDRCRVLRGRQWKMIHHTGIKVEKRGETYYFLPEG